MIDDETAGVARSRRAIRALLLMLLPVLAAPAQAQDYIFTTTNRTATITGYTGSGGDVTIPGTLKDLPVTCLEDNAFNGCSDLTSIIIPDSVTGIGSHAFQGCARLRNVVLGSRVTSIGVRAFFGCADLPTITIPNSVASVGDEAFWNCPSLTNVTIGSGVTNIGQGFSGCRSLRAVTVHEGNPAYSSVDGVLFSSDRTTLIQCPEGKAGSYAVPDNVISIGDKAFIDCAGLTNITIPDGVTTVGWDAFSGCAGLASVRIGRGITSIGDNGFRNCARLTDVTIGSSVASIGRNAFADCTRLTNITLPDNVTNISNLAFSWCTSLTGITIPDSVTNIGNDAFRCCTRLTNITIGRHVACIGSRFPGCNHLTTIAVDGLNTNYSSADGVLFSKDQTMLIRCPEGKAGNYTVPDGVVGIGSNAFADCTSLTNVTLPRSVTNLEARAFCYCTRLTNIAIPDNVKNIGDDAFRGCTSLTNISIGGGVASAGSRFSGCRKLATITVDPLNTTYDSVDGVLYNKSQTTLVQCPEGRAGSCEIPVGVTDIGSNAFADCSSLTSVTIPDSVTNIGVRAFCYCDSLTSITVPDKVTSVGEDAFRNCIGLTNLTIGRNVASIGGTFSGCPRLATITVDPLNPVYSSVDGVLFSKDRTTLIQCPEDKTGSYAIPASVTRIGDNAFADCMGLTRLAMPDSVTNIGYRAFAWCRGLNTLAIPQNVTSIESRAFESCTGLAGIYPKGNAPDVGSDVFINDDNLIVYYLPGTTGWGPKFGGRPATRRVVHKPSDIETTQ